MDSVASGLFAAWRRIADYVELRDSMPGAGAALTEVFSAGGVVLAQARLVELTGWDPDAVATVATHFGLVTLDYHDERALSRMAGALRLSARTGAPVARLAAWAQDAPDAEQAAEVVTAAKAGLDDESWAAAAKPRNDALRDRRRAALVGYLLAVLKLDSPERLFEHFLIDVEMTSATATSRVKQAISSVQLFVQRCLLNLELAVAPSSIDAHQWTWRRNYRVWQANREVFLFPENWVDPALRDGKSPFFAELESALLQADITPDNVERALRGYLDSLESVARLDICAMCAEPGADVVHFFARTLNEPPVYHHRTLTDGSLWSAWQRIPVDISSRQLAAVVWNRELRLYWPVYTQRGAEVRAKLAWTVHRDGGWLRRQVSTEDRAVTLPVVPAQTANLTWSAETDRGDLLIRGRLDHGVASAYYGGLNTWPPQVQTVDEYVSIATFRVPGCGGAVTGALDDGKSHPFADSDYVLAVAGPGVGLDLDPLGVDATGPGTILSALGKALPETTVTTLRPGTAFAPGEVLSYVDERRAYLVRSRWTGTITGQLTDPSQARFNLAFDSTVASAISTSSSADTLGSGSAVSLGSGSALAPGPQPVRSTGGNALLGANVSDSVSLTDAPSAWTALPRNHGSDVALTFLTHYHPHVCDFVHALNAAGLPGLMSLGVQRVTDAPPDKDTGTAFALAYAPTGRVAHPYPHEGVDFGLAGSYAGYNWELFFHAPLLIAGMLSADQRFEDAQRWYHYIFNPTSSSLDPAPGRYWNLRPFHDAGPGQRLADLLSTLDYQGGDPGILAQKAAVQAQLNAMAQDPFNPHHIARLRLSAYQKTTVMRYIDNLIAWGDQLFRRDTIEEINQATQLYVLAGALLGPRPERVPARQVTPKSYRELLDGGGLDDFANALVSLENAFPFTLGGGGSGGVNAPLGSTFYFCLPVNDKLLAYWDTVADRLFKIRHGQNIEGVARPLPLFEPPIDPGVLVRAVAAGVDLDSVLSDLTTPTPYYRFAAMLDRAKRLCEELNSLGAALLAALEKGDAEALGALRQTHEQALLSAGSRIRQQQVEEATLQRDALADNRTMVTRRRDFYATALAKGLSQGENDQFGYMELANQRHEDAAWLEAIAQIGSAIPNFNIPGISFSLGGQQIAAVFSAITRSYQYLATSYGYKGTRAGINAGYGRRADEWQREVDVANTEVGHLGKLIAAAEDRRLIAQYEADNHETQLTQSGAVLDFLRDKYTGEQLYRWTVSQLSTVYFQTYRLAYDVARQADRAYRFERAVDSSNFIQFGYWDSLKHGLLSGERLRLALAQLEDAYHRGNRRELELTRSVSLLLTDPMALLALKQTGECEISLPEALFDADHPGHYLRRVRSVSLTVPCVVGPYTNVNATLRLLRSRTRTSPVAAGDYTERDDDARFRYQYGAVDAIATSHGQRDAGLFELSFRDERYLPFEGAGAISTWRLEMPRDCNAFDYESITDVVLHLSYTARDGGAPLRDAARTAYLTPVQEGRRRLFSARQEYPDEWYRFLRPEPTADHQRMTLDLGLERFPFLMRGRAIEVTGARVFVKLADGVAYPGSGNPLPVGLSAPGDQTPAVQPLKAIPQVLAELPFTVFDRSGDPAKPGGYRIEVAETDVAALDPLLRKAVGGHQRLNAGVVHDLIVVLEYTA